VAQVKVNVWLGMKFVRQKKSKPKPVTELWPP